MIPVAAIQLFLMPLAVWGAATALGFSGEMRVALVLEAAMPSMVLGIVLADRYGLNTGVYAAALTTTTAEFGYVAVVVQLGGLSAGLPPLDAHGQDPRAARRVTRAV